MHLFACCSLLQHCFTDVHPPVVNTFVLRRLVLCLCGFYIAVQTLQKIRNSLEVCIWQISLAKLNFQTKIKMSSISGGRGDSFGGRVARFLCRKLQCTQLPVLTLFCLLLLP